ncbi:acyl-CoA carboxylase epsilon subunit [Cellulomonas sp. S1-8]|uniref:acyl-CoA carboxylase epsilon subunit n=1 Tax=Cellulomonas sp. S1-8 TaxID=2904790 RepID=UPI002244D226|nr:acyl-CoA carboxylase epsilon subunit [Cellulomonas sp. S1-8]UZN04428.1 acyl-CoA carboxylase epsilon subunit [Cellulomonas sp. S1-8]
MSTSDDDDAVRSDAHVQVVRGTPDDVELAALVAGLVAAASRRAPQEDGPDLPARAARARWTAPGRLRGTTAPVHGPDAWRWSLHP